jgi:pimeloyl-ACP methyl ester carboxylesterase
MPSSTHTVVLDDVGPIEITLDERGTGQPFLLLHGGGGPTTVSAFADTFATTKDVRVLIPTHPGFAGTPRPPALTTIRGLAQTYVALLDQLDLEDVTVIGNSVGGWIAAEMGLIADPRVSGVILVDAVGIEVPGHPVADFFSLTMDQVFSLSFHNPEPFRVDPQSLPPAAQAAAAANRDALATYAGAAMSDPTLLQRLQEMDTATLVLWGDSDQIVDPAYGRAYAAALPVARFQLLTDTGHLPQVETPQQLIDAIWNCGEADYTDQRDLGIN